MALIQVKKDPNIQQSEIIIPLTNSSQDESGNNYRPNQQELQQTLVYGIQSPLIKINNIIVDFVDVLDFDLKNTHVMPEISLTVRDRLKMLASIDRVGLDNELRIQILPKFDNKYKKINLTFYITSVKIDEDIVRIKGIYKSPKFLSSNIKSFGEVDTYTLFENICNETGLGLASNIDKNEVDKRFIYCDNISYQELLDREMKYANSETQVLDYWIDWWNNLVLVDIYERYNAVDKDEDMKVWVAVQQNEVTEGSQIDPVEVPALLQNSPTTQNSELYVKNYKIANKPTAITSQGSDRVYSIYEQEKGEYMDHLIQDGDLKKDIFTKFYYLGESYGTYNYLLAGAKRESFLQKISSNDTIKIYLKTPLLGLMRGKKINFAWYVNDDAIQMSNESYKENKIMNEPETPIPLESQETEDIDSNDNGKFEMDKTVSGQYLITGCRIKYQNKEWEYELTISRPSSQSQKIIKEDE